MAQSVIVLRSDGRSNPPGSSRCSSRLPAASADVRYSDDVIFKGPIISSMRREIFEGPSSFTRLISEQKQYQFNMWCGRQSLDAKHTRTPLHYDYHDNMYYVVQGVKEFRLLPPDADVPTVERHCEEARLKRAECEALGTCRGQRALPCPAARTHARTHTPICMLRHSTLTNDTLRSKGPTARLQTNTPQPPALVHLQHATQARRISRSRRQMSSMRWVLLRNGWLSGRVRYCTCQQGGTTKCIPKETAAIVVRIASMLAFIWR